MMKNPLQCICILGGVTLTLLCGAIDAQPATAATSTHTQITLKIAAQSMPKALAELAVQTGMQFIFPSGEIAKDLRAPALNGSYTPRAALKALLADSGLQEEWINDRTVAIRSAKPAGTDTRNKNSALSVSEAGAENRMEALMVAQGTGLSGDDAGDKRKEKNTNRETSGDVEEMIVEEGRIKPFAGANVDIPRTIDDVQPYYIFDSETIERSGALNMQDFLKQRLTMETTAQMPSQQVLGTSQQGNDSRFNLRGLGVDKTLVLINGRRITGNGTSSDLSYDLSAQADLNAIPLSAIDRVEVLPSSASGIYGGSAIGGVINVILKRNYTGGEVRATFDNTWDSDSPSRSVGATYGTTLGKNSVMFSAQWSDAKTLLLQDRRELFDRGIANILQNRPAHLYSSTSPFLGALPNITSTSERINNVLIPDPANLTLKNGTSLGARSTYIAAGTAPGISATALSDMLYANRGRFNLDLPATAQNPSGLMRQSSLIPDTQSFMLTVGRELLPGTDVTLALARTQNNSSVSSSVNIPTSITVSSTSPLNPFTSAVRVTNPSTATLLGNNFETTNDSVSLGFTSRLPRNWMVQADLTWSHNVSDWTYSFYSTSLTNLNLMANNGTLNPFVDLLLYPATIDWGQLSNYQRYHSSSTAKALAVRGSGVFWQLPWGQANLTSGLEYRHSLTPENYGAGWGPPLTPVMVFRSVWTGFKREQTNSSAYAEVSVPLIKPNWLPLFESLELQLSGRSERLVQDIGTGGMMVNASGVVTGYLGTTRNGQPFFSQASYATTNKTIGFKYQPIAGITLRASQATAFLPPTSWQLLKNPLPDTNPTTITDPLRNSAQVSIGTISGGNPDLTPQNSKSTNAGVIWEPTGKALQGLRLNAEYYRIEQFDAISGLSAQQVVNNESIFSDRVTRDASGNITFVDTSYLNLYYRETEGWDLSADYQVKTKLGRFNLHAVESVILGLRNQYSLTLPAYDSVGFPSEGGAAKYKSNLQLTWEHRNLTVSWGTRYFGSYKQNGALGGPDATQRLANNPNATLNTNNTLAQGSDTIPAQIYHDVFFGYAFSKSGARDGNLASAFRSHVLSGVTLQAGVKNVFNTLPPFDVYYDYYVSPYGDTRLRSYWLSAKKAF